MKSVKADSAYELQQKLIRYAAGRGFEQDLIFKVLETEILQSGYCI